jgi:gliding motility-associated-like protein
MKEGTYSVKIENSYHCSSTDSIKIVDLTDLYIRIESLSDFCDKRQTVLKANTIASDVVWNTGDTTKEIEIIEAGTYYVTGTEMGCVVKDFFVIDPCQFRIFIPNAITPGDNNSYNDCFYLKIPETIEITSFEITIFDRFGNKVFNSKDLKFQWCGTTINDGIAHDNVFSYIISIEENGKKYNYRGTILVL